ncbi:MAG: signal peptidase I [Bdellovibrionales bacterium]|nr:signal peptidase I [Bdellovibrionales bacterium]
MNGSPNDGRHGRWATIVESLRPHFAPARQYGLVLLGAAAAAFTLRSCAVESFRLPTDSMRPTLLPGDLILADKWSFGLRFPGADEPFFGGRKPHPPEIVVYEGDQAGHYVKRVVAGPGDSVGLIKGRLILNGVTLPFIDDPATGACGREEHPGGSYSICLDPPLLPDEAPALVPAGHVYLLSDLRSEGASLDRGGAQRLDRIRGRVRLIWLSIEPRGPDDTLARTPGFRLDRILTLVR